MEELLSVEARYAEAAGARAAWVVEASHAPAALACTGLAAEAVLVVCANDFEQAFAHGFPCRCVRFLNAPVVDDFVGASIEARSAGLPVIWFVNSVGCRGLRVADVRSLAARARELDVLLAVDNTVPSFFGCRACELGAAVVLEALDRVMAGAGPCRAVAVSVAHPHGRYARRRYTDECAAWAFDHMERMRAAGSLDVTGRTGELATVLGSGIASMPARMQAHMDHARAVAEYLAAHDGLRSVSYPGLSSHVDRSLASTVLSHGAGPAIDIELPSGWTASMLFDSLDSAYRSSPAGGAHTRVSALDGVDGCAVRLFAGTDDPLGVIDDLDRALAASLRDECPSR